MSNHKVYVILVHVIYEKIYLFTVFKGKKYSKNTGEAYKYKHKNVNSVQNSKTKRICTSPSSSAGTRVGMVPPSLNTGIPKDAA